MLKETVNQAHWTQRGPGRINPRRNKPRHTVIKLTITKDKDKLLKTREKWQMTYKGILIRLSADFPTETLQTRRERHDIFKVMKGKKLQPRILYPARLSLLDGEIKSFPAKQKLREFSTSKHFTMNAKGTSLSRKHKTRKRPTGSKPKTIKKMVIGSYISMINLI